MKSSVLALSVLTMCVLAACGGGGGDDSSAAAPAAQADPALVKYVGTWEVCNTYTNGSSLSRARVLSVQGDTATVEMDVLNYAAASCAGTPSLDVTAKGTAKMAGGTKTLPAQDRGISLSARTYEKVVYTYTGFTLRMGTLQGVTLPMPNTTRNSLIALGADGKVYFGLATLDADGYPKYQSATSLTKRP
jgi:hypothetical protein